MKRFIGAVLAMVLVSGFGGHAAAEGDKDALAIVGKAIQALGGEQKLGMVKAVEWKAKGTIVFGDNENAFTSVTIVQDMDHFRREFEGDFGGNKFKGVTVVKGDKGWRKFGDNNMELDKDALANEKHNTYLQIAVMTLVPLRGKGFKVALAPQDNSGGLVAVLATGPDGKHFKLYFDAKSGLPVKQVATVAGFMNDEFVQETTLGNYKEFDGIKRATKISSKRNGEKFLDQEITEFKLLKKVDPKTFAEPE